MSLSFLCQQLLTPRETIAPALLRVDAGRVVSVGPPGPAPEPAVEISGTVVPGLVDLQVNGWGHHHVLGGTTEEIGAIAADLLGEGVTAWCPTIVSASEEARVSALDAVATARERPAASAGARIIGVHLEGPWISTVRAGAHDRGVLEHPTERALDRSLERHARLVRIVTLAPELRGGLDAVRQVVAAGAIASVGHSDASYEEAVKAFDAGARMATHLFNAMRPLHHRDPGVVGAVLADERIVAGLIADAIHLHLAAVFVAFRAKGSGRIALVSDAVASAGLDTSTGAARLRDGTLAGAFAGLGEGVSNAVHAGVPLGDAVQAATLTPADLLGVKLGRLEPGATADFAVLDDAARPVATYLGGERVWERRSI